MSDRVYRVEEKDAVEGWVESQRTQEQIDRLRARGVEVRILGEITENRNASVPWTHWGTRR